MQPPKITRRVGTSTFEPAVFALRIPVRVKPRTVKATIVAAALPGVGAKAPINGIKPPAVNAAADAIAA
jgi:hypothetical protein